MILIQHELKSVPPQRYRKPVSNQDRRQICIRKLPKAKFFSDEYEDISVLETTRIWILLQWIWDTPNTNRMDPDARHE